MGNLHKTKGVVLNFIKYKESSIITKIFTEEFGVKSYIVNGVRSKKSKTNKIAFFQPLTFLNLVVYNKENTDLNRIATVHIYKPYSSLCFEFRKVSISIFLAEFLGKAIKEEGANPNLYHFLNESLFAFDELLSEYENFHIQLLLKLANHLGFAVFDAQDLNLSSSQNFLIDNSLHAAINHFIQTDYSDFLPLNGKKRWEILQALIQFYQFHVENFGAIKSLPILREILS